MAVLMPQHALPVGRPFALRCRTVGGDHAAKADAEKTCAAREAKGADREVLLLRKDLDDHDSRRIDFVFRTEHLAGFGEQFQHGVAIDRRFTGIHPHQDAVAAEGRKTLQPIIKGHQVISDDVIRILIGHGLSELPADIIMSESQQVFGELKACSGMPRIKRQRAPLVLGPFGEAVELGQFATDEVIDFGVFSPGAQRRGPHQLLDLALAAEVRDHGQQCPGFGLVHIHLQHLRQHRFGVGVAFAVDRGVGRRQQTGNMPGIALQGPLQRRVGLLGITRSKCT